MSAGQKLPPTDRDFEIYESVHIQNCSTRHIADRHHLSQTRVRQIIRRVVEWLGEILPPQAKVAKEQELYLARQIAADRFQHQLEEVTGLWEDTRESKYAGIRIRLTTAQARLGVVGGVAAGLAADAIEGLPVPAWQPPAEPQQEPEDEDSDQPNAAVRRPQKSEPLPWYCYDPVALKDITPEIIAAREAYGRPWSQPIIDAVIKLWEEELGGWPPRSQPEHSGDEMDSQPPPIEGCSTSAGGRADLEQASFTSADGTGGHETTCDDSVLEGQDAAQAKNPAARPLLTSDQQLATAEMKVSPDQPGVAVHHHLATQRSMLPTPDPRDHRSAAVPATPVPTEP